MSNKTLIIQLNISILFLFNVLIQRSNNERFLMQNFVSYSRNWKG